jgi:hypothetical protein
MYLVTYDSQLDALVVAPENAADLNDAAQWVIECAGFTWRSDIQAFTRPGQDPRQPPESRCGSATSVTTFWPLRDSSTSTPSTTPDHRTNQRKEGRAPARRSDRRRNDQRCGERRRLPGRLPYLGVCQVGQQHLRRPAGAGVCRRRIVAVASSYLHFVCVVGVTGHCRATRSRLGNIAHCGLAGRVLLLEGPRRAVDTPRDLVIAGLGVTANIEPDYVPAAVELRAQGRAVAVFPAGRIGVSDYTLAFKRAPVHVLTRRGFGKAGRRQRVTGRGGLRGEQKPAGQGASCEENHRQSTRPKYRKCAHDLLSFPDADLAASAGPLILASR